MLCATNGSIHRVPAHATITITSLVAGLFWLAQASAAHADLLQTTAQTNPLQITGANWINLPLGEGTNNNSVYRNFTAPAESTVAIHFTGTCSVKSSNKQAVIALEIWVWNNAEWGRLYPYRFGTTPLCASDGSGSASTPVVVTTIGHIGGYEAFFSGAPNQMLARARLVNGAAGDSGVLDNYAFVIVTDPY
jgi:hypothetical protein